VNLALGGEKIRDAFYIFQELSEKHASTPLLLNGLAVCDLLQKKYPEAEKHLLEALEKSPNDPETLANLITTTSMLGRTAQTTRYLNQLRKIAPKHASIQQLDKVDEIFTRNASRFSA